MRVSFRPIVVLWALVPFVISLLRDFRKYVLVGEPRVLTEDEKRERAERLTMRIASLGPTFIKLVQVLAMREDLLPKLYTDEFKKLQDRVPPFPMAQLREIVHAEFGKPLEDIFADFDPEPIAAASLGQVHRARHDGEEVAVKVLRPGVEQLVASDLRIIRRILRAIRAIYNPRFYLRNLTTVVNEFARVVFDEMNFMKEAENIEAFRITLAQVPHVVVPEVHATASTRRVLTLKFYEGVRLDDIEHLRSVNVDPMELLRTLVTLYTRMIVVDGLLHADPHPGNLLIAPDGRVVLLDFGMVVRFDPEVRIELLKTAVASVRGDANGVVNGFYKLGMVQPGTNLAMLRDAARVLININYTTGYTPRMIQRIGEDILKTFYQFPIRVPSGLVYLLRASALIEGIGITFDPRFNALRFSRPIITPIVREVYFESGRSPVDRVIDKATELYEFVGNLERVLFRAEREELRVRVHPGDLIEIEGYFAGLQRRIIVGMSAVALAIVTAIIYTRIGNVWLLLAGEALAFFVFFMLVILPMRPRWRE